MLYLCTAISHRNLQLFRSGLLGAARAEAKLVLILPSRDKKLQNFGTKFCGNSSVGRARPCQGRGREFESRFPLTVLSNMNHSFHADFLEQREQCQTRLSIAESRQKADWRSQAEIAQLVEHDLAKVGVASSSLVFRSDISA